MLEKFIASLASAFFTERGQPKQARPCRRSCGRSMPQPRGLTVRLREIWRFSRGGRGLAATGVEGERLSTTARLRP